MAGPSLHVESQFNNSDHAEASPLPSIVAPTTHEQSASTGHAREDAHGSSVSEDQSHVAGTIPRSSEEIRLDGDDEISTLLPTELDQRCSNGTASPSLSNEGKAPEATHSVLLHRSGYIVFMVAIYSDLALTAWILTCLLTHDPLTIGSYEVNVNESSYRYSAKYSHARYVKSEEIYRAARTLQAIVAVLTIPLTSAVCSAAAVTFTQAGPKQPRTTMRQLMVLADKGWTDPATILKLLFGDRQRYASRLLIIAVLLNILGKLAREFLYTG